MQNEEAKNQESIFGKTKNIQIDLNERTEALHLTGWRALLFLWKNRPWLCYSDNW